MYKFLCANIARSRSFTTSYRKLAQRIQQDGSKAGLSTGQQQQQPLEENAEEIQEYIEEDAGAPDTSRPSTSPARTDRIPFTTKSKEFGIRATASNPIPLSQRNKFYAGYQIEIGPSIENFASLEKMFVGSSIIADSPSVSRRYFHGSCLLTKRSSSNDNKMGSNDEARSNYIHAMRDLSDIQRSRMQSQFKNPVRSGVSDVPSQRGMKKTNAIRYPLHTTKHNLSISKRYRIRESSAERRRKEVENKIKLHKQKLQDVYKSKKKITYPALLENIQKGRKPPMVSTSSSTKQTAPQPSSSPNIQIITPKKPDDNNQLVESVETDLDKDFETLVKSHPTIENASKEAKMKLKHRFVQILLKSNRRPKKRPIKTPSVQPVETNNETVNSAPHEQESMPVKGSGTATEIAEASVKSTGIVSHPEQLVDQPEETDYRHLRYPKRILMEDDQRFDIENVCMKETAVKPAPVHEYAKAVPTPNYKNVAREAQKLSKFVSRTNSHSSAPSAVQEYAKAVPTPNYKNVEREAQKLSKFVNELLPNDHPESTTRNDEAARDTKQVPKKPIGWEKDGDLEKCVADLADVQSKLTNKLRKLLLVHENVPEKTKYPFLTRQKSSQGQDTLDDLSEVDILNERARESTQTSRREKLKEQEKKRHEERINEIYDSPSMRSANIIPRIDKVTDRLEEKVEIGEKIKKKIEEIAPQEILEHKPKNSNTSKVKIDASLADKTRPDRNNPSKSKLVQSNSLETGGFSKRRVQASERNVDQNLDKFQQMDREERVLNDGNKPPVEHQRNNYELIDSRWKNWGRAKATELDENKGTETSIDVEKAQSTGQELEKLSKQRETKEPEEREIGNKTSNAKVMESTKKSTSHPSELRSNQTEVDPTLPNTTEEGIINSVETASSATNVRTQPQVDDPSASKELIAIDESINLLPGLKSIRYAPKRENVIKDFRKQVLQKYFQTELLAGSSEEVFRPNEKALTKELHKNAHLETSASSTEPFGSRSLPSALEFIEKTCELSQPSTLDINFVDKNVEMKREPECQDTLDLLEAKTKINEALEKIRLLENAFNLKHLDSSKQKKSDNKLRVPPPKPPSEKGKKDNTKERPKGPNDMVLPPRHRDKPKNRSSDQQDLTKQIVHVNLKEPLENEQYIAVQSHPEDNKSKIDEENRLIDALENFMKVEKLDEPTIADKQISNQNSKGSKDDAASAPEEKKTIKNIPDSEKPSVDMKSSCSQSKTDENFKGPSISEHFFKRLKEQTLRLSKGHNVDNNSLNRNAKQKSTSDLQKSTDLHKIAFKKTRERPMSCPANASKPTIRLNNSNNTQNTKKSTSSSTQSLKTGMHETKTKYSSWSLQKGQSETKLSSKGTMRLKRPKTTNPTDNKEPQTCKNKDLSNDSDEKKYKDKSNAGPERSTLNGQPEIVNLKGIMTEDAIKRVFGVNNDIGSEVEISIVAVSSPANLLEAMEAKNSDAQRTSGTLKNNEKPVQSTEEVAAVLPQNTINAEGERYILEKTDVISNISFYQPNVLANSNLQQEIEPEKNATSQRVEDPIVRIEPANNTDPEIVPVTQTINLVNKNFQQFAIHEEQNTTTITTDALRRSQESSLKDNEMRGRLAINPKVRPSETGKTSNKKYTTPQSITLQLPDLLLNSDRKWAVKSEPKTPRKQAEIQRLNTTKAKAPKQPDCGAKAVDMRCEADKNLRQTNPLGTLNVTIPKELLGKAPEPSDRGTKAMDMRCEAKENLRQTNPLGTLNVTIPKGLLGKAPERSDRGTKAMDMRCEANENLRQTNPLGTLNVTIPKGLLGKAPERSDRGSKAVDVPCEADKNLRQTNPMETLNVTISKSLLDKAPKRPQSGIEAVDMRCEADKNLRQTNPLGILNVTIPKELLIKGYGSAFHLREKSVQKRNLPGGYRSETKVSKAGISTSPSLKRLSDKDFPSRCKEKAIDHAPRKGDDKHNKEMKAIFHLDDSGEVYIVKKADESTDIGRSTTKRSRVIDEDNLDLVKNSIENVVAKSSSAERNPQSGTIKAGTGIIMGHRAIDADLVFKIQKLAHSTQNPPPPPPIVELRTQKSKGESQRLEAVPERIAFKSERDSGNRNADEGNANKLSDFLRNKLNLTAKIMTIYDKKSSIELRATQKLRKFNRRLVLPQKSNNKSWKPLFCDLAAPTFQRIKDDFFENGLKQTLFPSGFDVKSDLNLFSDAGGPEMNVLLRCQSDSKIDTKEGENQQLKVTVESDSRTAKAPSELREEYDLTEGNADILKKQDTTIKTVIGTEEENEPQKVKVKSDSHTAKAPTELWEEHDVIEGNKKYAHMQDTEMNGEKAYETKEQQKGTVENRTTKVPLEQWEKYDLVEGNEKYAHMFKKPDTAINDKTALETKEENEEPKVKVKSDSLTAKAPAEQRKIYDIIMGNKTHADMPEKQDTAMVGDKVIETNKEEEKKVKSDSRAAEAPSQRSEEYEFIRVNKKYANMLKKIAIAINDKKTNDIKGQENEQPKETSPMESQQYETYNDESAIETKVEDSGLNKTNNNYYDLVRKRSKIVSDKTKDTTKAQTSEEPDTEYNFLKANRTHAESLRTIEAKLQSQRESQDAENESTDKTNVNDQKTEKIESEPSNNNVKLNIKTVEPSKEPKTFNNSTGPSNTVPTQKQSELKDPLKPNLTKQIYCGSLKLDSPTKTPPRVPAQRHGASPELNPSKYQGSLKLEGPKKTSSQIAGNSGANNETGKKPQSVQENRANAHKESTNASKVIKTRSENEVDAKKFKTDQKFMFAGQNAPTNKLIQNKNDGESSTEQNDETKQTCKIPSQEDVKEKQSTEPQQLFDDKVPFDEMVKMAKTREGPEEPAKRIEDNVTERPKPATKYKFPDNERFASVEKSWRKKSLVVDEPKKSADIEVPPEGDVDIVDNQQKYRDQLQSAIQKSQKQKQIQKHSITSKKEEVNELNNAASDILRRQEKLEREYSEKSRQRQRYSQKDTKPVKPSFGNATWDNKTNSDISNTPEKKYMHKGSNSAHEGNKEKLISKAEFLRLKKLKEQAKTGTQGAADLYLDTNVIALEAKKEDTASKTRQEAAKKRQRLAELDRIKEQQTKEQISKLAEMSVELLKRATKNNKLPAAKKRPVIIENLGQTPDKYLPSKKLISKETQPIKGSKKVEKKTAARSPSPPTDSQKENKSFEKSLEPIPRQISKETSVIDNNSKKQIHKSIEHGLENKSFEKRLKPVQTQISKETSVIDNNSKKQIHKPIEHGIENKSLEKNLKPIQRQLSKETSVIDNNSKKQIPKPIEPGIENKSFEKNLKPIQRQISKETSVIDNNSKKQIHKPIEHGIENKTFEKNLKLIQRQISKEPSVIDNNSKKQIHNATEDDIENKSFEIDLKPIQTEISKETSVIDNNSKKQVHKPIDHGIENKSFEKNLKPIQTQISKEPSVIDNNSKKQIHKPIDHGIENKSFEKNLKPIQTQISKEPSVIDNPKKQIHKAIEHGLEADIKPKPDPFQLSSECQAFKITKMVQLLADDLSKREKYGEQSTEKTKQTANEQKITVSSATVNIVKAESSAAKTKSDVDQGSNVTDKPSTADRPNLTIKDDKSSIYIKTPHIILPGSKTIEEKTSPPISQAEAETRKEAIEKMRDLKNKNKIERRIKTPHVKDMLDEGPQEQSTPDAEKQPQNPMRKRKRTVTFPTKNYCSKLVLPKKHPKFECENVPETTLGIIVGEAIKTVPKEIAELCKISTKVDNNPVIKYLGLKTRHYKGKKSKDKKEKFLPAVRSIDPNELSEDLKNKIINYRFELLRRMNEEFMSQCLKQYDPPYKFEEKRKAPLEVDSLSLKDAKSEQTAKKRTMYRVIKLLEETTPKLKPVLKDGGSGSVGNSKGNDGKPSHVFGPFNRNDDHNGSGNMRRKYSTGSNNDNCDDEKTNVYKTILDNFSKQNSACPSSQNEECKDEEDEEDDEEEDCDDSYNVAKEVPHAFACPSPELEEERQKDLYYRYHQMTWFDLHEYLHQKRTFTIDAAQKGHNTDGKCK